MEAIAGLLLLAALVAFWLHQWHQPIGRGMTNRAIVLWSLGLSLPVQYSWLLAFAVIELVTTGGLRGGDGGSFGCSNFHGSLSPCSFGEMLMNRLYAILFINVLSFGIAFLLMAAIIGAVLLGWRRWRK